MIIRDERLQLCPCCSHLTGNAKNAPDNIAFIEGGRQLSYQQLISVKKLLI
jgi:hypothetical protein